MDDIIIYDEYIEFETAKLAKKLGYSNGSKTAAILYKSTYIYDEDPDHHESYKEGEIRFSKQFWIKNGVEDNENFEYFELPTQALLYKWLRERHQIQINISHTYKENGELYFLPTIVDFNPIFGIREIINPYLPVFGITTFKNHEDCFEKCLQVVLKYLLNRIN